MKVFLVDDSPVVIERLDALLQELPGVEVLGSAGDVLEATKSIMELKPDAVVLDLHLHGGTGFDVLRTVKSMLPETTILVCTSFPHAQYQAKCFREGASFFLDKYTEFEKLPDILCALIKNTAAVSVKR